MTTRTAQFKDFILTITDIITSGLKIAVTVLALTLGILQIYQTPNLGVVQLIAQVGAFLLAAVIALLITNAFDKFNKVQIKAPFWVMAFIVGGIITAQYIADPLTTVSLPDILPVAVLIAMPAWLYEAATKFSDYLSQQLHQRDEKRKNAARQQSEVDHSRLAEIPNNLPGEFYTAEQYIERLKEL